MKIEGRLRTSLKEGLLAKVRLNWKIGTNVENEFSSAIYEIQFTVSLTSLIKRVV